LKEEETMKIKLTDDMKRVITIDKLEAIQVVNNGMKEQKNLKWEAEQALALATKNLVTAEILKVDAEIALNHRVWNYYGEGSADVDVWMTLVAYSPVFGCYDIRCYLSDIWSLGSENRDEIKQHLSIRHYTDSECI
jgi:hypothetical protein